MHSDHEKYEEFILSYNDTVEKVLTESQEKILQVLNIEKEVFEESVL